MSEKLRFAVRYHGRLYFLTGLPWTKEILEQTKKYTAVGSKLHAISEEGNPALLLIADVLWEG